MNMIPSAITVLCYGDSNTHGTKPDRSGRFAADERWTGILQTQLGDGYYVIEEGLGGRTTDLDHYVPTKPNRSGITYFKACFESHAPLDIVIIMLGTNDMKTFYNRPVGEIGLALEQYPEYIAKLCDSWKIRRPRIVLVSPPRIDATAPKFVESMPTPGVYDETSVRKSEELASIIKQLAARTVCQFFDAASVTNTGEDGLHLNLQSHKALAEALSTVVRGKNE